MTEPVRWLNEEERRIWLAWLMSTRLLWDELERDLQRDSGIGFGYYDILVILSEQPDHTLRMSDLASATQTSRSRLSHAVARLEELGWVQRVACPTDRRGQNAVLTDTGFAALEAAAPPHVASVRTHLFDQLTAEQLDQLRDISETLLEHLAPIAAAHGDFRGQLVEAARAKRGEGPGC